jgi:hypothetical protein
MSRLAALVVVVLSLAAAFARADQCQLVERDVAERAMSAIRASRGRVLAHCAPCGDPPPSAGAAFVPRSVSSTGSSLLVDGTERDLAYLYLEVAPNVFENVALRTGCPASEVPQVWDFTGGSARARSFGSVPPALAPYGWGASRRTSAARGPLPG